MRISDWSSDVCSSDLVTAPRTTREGPTMTDYKNTVFLPKTDLPMRAGLPQREPELLAWWQGIDLDHRIVEVRRGREKFILLHGPPYANGHLHIGHATTQILHDDITRPHPIAGRPAVASPACAC